MRERVKIHPTDVDEGAVAQARQAIYSSRDVEGIPAALLSKYFENSGSDYTFSRDLRRVVIFGRHDLIQDAPISRVDLPQYVEVFQCRCAGAHPGEVLLFRFLESVFTSLRSAVVVLDREDAPVLQGLAIGRMNRR